MIRRRKDVDWGKRLAPEDMSHVLVRVDPAAWYPMETFERLGDAILAEVAQGSLDAVREWGRSSAVQLRTLQPFLVAAGDPLETLRRFRVLQDSFFDFSVVDLASLSADQALVEIHYHMGKTAEEAASYQMMGFIERLLELAGASQVRARFVARSWKADPATRLELRWKPPG
jgi:hypothetical protein